VIKYNFLDPLLNKIRKLIIIIWNYFTGKFREFYLLSKDQFYLQNIQRNVYCQNWSRKPVVKQNFYFTKKVVVLYTILASFEKKMRDLFLRKAGH